MNSKAWDRPEPVPLIIIFPGFKSSSKASLNASVKDEGFKNAIENREFNWNSLSLGNYLRPGPRAKGLRAIVYEPMLNGNFTQSKIDQSSTNK